MLLFLFFEDIDIALACVETHAIVAIKGRQGVCAGRGKAGRSAHSNHRENALKCTNQRGTATSCQQDEAFYLQTSPGAISHFTSAVIFSADLAPDPDRGSFPSDPDRGSFRGDPDRGSFPRIRTEGLFHESGPRVFSTNPDRGSFPSDPAIRTEGLFGTIRTGGLFRAIRTEGLFRAIRTEGLFRKSGPWVFSTIQNRRSYRRVDRGIPTQFGRSRVDCANDKRT